MASEKGLAERMRDLKMRDAGESDEEAIQRALDAKAELRQQGPDEERVRRLSERLEAYRSEDRRRPGWTPPIDLPTEGPRRWMDWLLGRQEQDPGEGVVTPLPPVRDGWVEDEFYAVEAPYAFIRILRSQATGERIYEVIEPPMEDRNRRVFNFLQEALVRGLRTDPGRMEAEERKAFLRAAVDQILRDYGIRITVVDQQRVEYHIMRDFLGLGPIHAMMLDPHIEDISCDGADVPVFVFHRRHEAMPSTVQFEDDLHLDGFVIRMAQQAGKAISISAPILDAALPDGSRLQATLGREVTENGSTFTIRRFRPDPFSPVDLVRFGTMSASMLAWFWMIVESGHSLVLSGGTASGKTTSLNAICQFIPMGAKIVSIEDTREVNLPHENWIKAVTRTGSATEGSGEIGMFELLKAALRQRPEYILVGEVRGIEATVAFQAMATGHTVYSTMHADSARSVVYRLENDPIKIPRLVLQALDVVAIQAQVRADGKRVRRIREVVELVGMDPMTRELLTNKVFEWDANTDTFTYAGRSYMLERIAAERNWSRAEIKAEHDRRTRLLEAWIADKEMDLARITKGIQAYERDPAGVLGAAGLEGALEVADESPS